MRNKDGNRRPFKPGTMAPERHYFGAPGLPALVLSEPEVSEPADFRVSSGALLMFCLFVKLFLPGAEGYSSRGFSEHGMIYFGNSENPQPT